ncbi:MAG: hypothetical protein HKN29_01625 [Rhodothermales bacterium]|nr:hypothetical protein [Rhodothermales bacterium]
MDSRDVGDHLVVTNGSSAVEALRGVGITHKALSWDDVLHDGPLPSLDPAALRKVRAGYLSRMGPEAASPGPGAGDLAVRAEARRAEVEAALAARDATLANWPGPITLWFEHDLYDQLQLVQILDRLDGRSDVFLIQQDTFIAESPGGVAAWEGLRRPVTQHQVEVAKSTWRAVTSPTPEQVVALGVGFANALPHLGPSLFRFLQMLPGPSGVNRTEAAVLEVLASGPATGGVLFRETQRREEAPFRGDWSFWDLLAGLEGLLVGDSSAHPARVTWSLGDLGRSVLEGEVDRVDAVGLDRWWGGTHLTPGSDWRWDENRLTRRRETPT